MNPYSVLGVDRNADKDTVKKAYRKLAMKFHPDRNDGKDEKFKEVKAAYDKIKDGPPTVKNPFTGFGDFDFSTTTENFSDILREARYQHQMQVSVTAIISLKDAVLGPVQYMQIPIRGKTESVKIAIPPGVMNNESVKYPKVSNGVDVVIKYKITPDPVWSVENLNLIKQQEISIWDLITGTSLNVETIDGSILRLRIPPRTQPGTHMRVTGKGVTSRQLGVTNGDMLVRLNGKIPDDISPAILNAIREDQLNI